VWTLLITNWRTVLLATVIASSVAYGAVMTLRLKAVTAERDEKIAVIESMRSAAQTYQENSQRIAKEIKDAHAELLVAVENQAYENARKKFGTVARCPAVSIGTRGLLPNSSNGDGQAGSAGSADAATEESVAVDRPFIDACGYDAGTVTMWQDWAKRNALPITKE